MSGEPALMHAPAKRDEDAHCLEKALVEVKKRIENVERYRTELDRDLANLKATERGLENAIRIMEKDSGVQPIKES